jgi:hypothetical protein
LALNDFTVTNTIEIATGYDGRSVDQDFEKRLNRLVEYCISLFGEVSSESLYALVYCLVGSTAIERAVADILTAKNLFSRIMRIGAQLHGRDNEILCLKAKSWVLFNTLFSSEFRHGTALKEIVGVWKSLVMTAGRYHPVTVECIVIAASLQWFRNPDFYVSNYSTRLLVECVIET